MNAPLPSCSPGPADILQHRQTPLLTLPSELLANIFYFLTGAGPSSWRLYWSDDFDFESSQSNCRLGWIVVTHVCRYWRRVAIETPALWTQLSFNIGEEWALEMMRRSKQAPVSVMYRFLLRAPNTRLKEQVIDYVIANLSHIQELEMENVSYTDVDGLLTSLTATPAPVLRELFLHPGLSSDGLVANGPIYFLGSLFARQAPQLHSVHLWGNFQMEWSDAVLPFDDLRRLSILLPEFEPAPLPLLPSDLRTRLPTHDQLIETLQRLPHLTSLTLWNVLPALRTYGTMGMQKQSINLSNLQKLNLRGGVFECLALLSSFMFDPHIYLDLELQPCMGHPTQFDPVFPFLISHIIAHDQRLPIELRQKRLFIFIGSDSLSIMLMSTHHKYWCLQVTFLLDTEQGIPHHLEIIKKCADTLKIYQIVDLNMTNINCIHSVEDWTFILARFPHVQTVVFDSMDATYFEDALSTTTVLPSQGFMQSLPAPDDTISTDSPTSSRGSEDTWLLPRLREIGFTNIDFREYSDVNDFFARLAHSLRTRIEFGVHPVLDTVFFDDCAMRQEKAVIFKEVAKHVQCEQDEERCEGLFGDLDFLGTHDAANQA